MYNSLNISRLATSPPPRTGQTMTEYALIMAAIAIVAIVAYTTLGTTIVTLVNNVIACL